MLIKLISALASFLMLFSFLFPEGEIAKESGDILMENVPCVGENRIYDTVNGVSDSVFYIQRPSDGLNTVFASSFGISEESADNYPALTAALAYCGAHPDTKLVFEKGRYYLNNADILRLTGFSNILIEGNGAELVFSQVRTGMEIFGCDCVEIRGLSFDWDWEKLPLSDIVTVKNADKKTHTLDFVFENERPDENTVIAAVSQCDPETLTYGAKYSNKEVYVYMDADNIRGISVPESGTLRIVHNGCFDNFSDGEKYILRHYVYDSTFAVLNGASRNITFNGVSLYGYPGAGFYVGEKTSHFQIIDSFIGVKPGTGGVRHTSLGADAIHIVNSDGCFRISGCDISGQGDDALNVHDGLGVVKSVSGNKITVLGNAMYLRTGDELKFRDEKFRETNLSAVITELTWHPETVTYDLTLDRDLTGLAAENHIVSNLSCCSENYVVSDNYIHENRARGFLLQSSHGLCENNRFYKTEMQAIKIIMDISTGLWYEGTGVNDLTVTGNVFDSCDYIATGEVITVGSNIDGKTAVCRPFTDIRVTDNTFVNLTERVLNANNAQGLVFSGNTIDAGRDLPRGASSARAYFGRYCGDIVFRDNIWKNCLLGEIAEAETPAVWAEINSANGSVC